jgi:hypothetical protein
MDDLFEGNESDFHHEKKVNDDLDNIFTSDKNDDSTKRYTDESIDPFCFERQDESDEDIKLFIESRKNEVASEVKT